MYEKTKIFTKQFRIVKNEEKKNTQKIIFIAIKMWYYYVVNIQKKVNHEKSIAKLEEIMENML